jgi:O-antigen/teichoic acid export membrane protein
MNAVFQKRGCFMRRRYNPYNYPPWLKQIRGIFAQVIIPICIFQGFRTIFLPTTFDVFLLGIFIFLAVCFHLDWL